MPLSEQDGAVVTAAVHGAEASTSGEIVTVLAGASDRYHDVAAHWATLAALAVPAFGAAFPGPILSLLERFGGGWNSAAGVREVLTASLIGSALVFLLALLLLRSVRLRMTLTPPATKTRRVRRRAVELFKAAAERRTHGRTGVLLYLSLAEHRAEIVADEVIHSKVSPEVWGEAMAALVTAVKAGRTGEGMAAAVTAMGKVLAEHFPREADDRNELPDRLITL